MNCNTPCQCHTRTLPLAVGHLTWYLHLTGSATAIAQIYLFIQDDPAFLVDLMADKYRNLLFHPKSRHTNRAWFTEHLLRAALDPGHGLVVYVSCRPLSERESPAPGQAQQGGKGAPGSIL